MTHGEKSGRRFGELFAQLGARPVVKALQPAMPGDVAGAVRGEGGEPGRADREIRMEAYEERAGILEFCAGMSREEAERFAYEQTAPNIFECLSCYPKLCHCSNRKAA